MHAYKYAGVPHVVLVIKKIIFKLVLKGFLLSSHVADNCCSRASHSQAVMRLQGSSLLHISRDRDKQKRLIRLFMDCLVYYAAVRRAGDGHYSAFSSRS